MRFGLLYEARRPFQGTSVHWNTLYKETLEQCVLAEKVGFDNLWFVEHHFLTGFSGSPCPDPGEVRPPLRVHLAERHRAARGGAGADAHRSVSVVGSTGGRATQGEVTPGGS